MILFDRLQESLAAIRAWQPAADANAAGQTIADFSPRFGLILGTGLAGLAEEIDVHFTIPYQEIPHFPLSTVEFHPGRLLFGYLEGKPVVAMQGRFHYYEGYDMEQVTYGVRVMKLLGIEKLLITNAAGGINPGFSLGDLMIITDHINLLPGNPLTGKNDPRLGVRFPDMYEAYDRKLVALAESCAAGLQLPVKKGVYAAVQGPNLETPAEYRFLHVAGADAVGMSTVPEVIASVHMGLPVCAISVITDLCSPGNLKPVNIKDILDTASRAEPGLGRLVRQMFASF